MVGAGQSTVALEATSAAEHLQTPFVVSSGAADEITGRKLAYTFRLCPKADWYARDQVAFLEALKDLAGLDITSVALLHEDGEYGTQTAASQRAYLAEAGIQVVADIEYSAALADLHSQILEIKQSGAQAILTATLLNDAALIAQSAAVLHANVPIVDAAGGVLAPGFISNAGDSAEKIMSVAAYAAGSAPSLEAKMTGSSTPVDADMLYGYQAVWVLADALERVGSTDGPRLRAALATTALSGEHLVLPQDLLTFDGTGQNRDARLPVVQVQKGRMVTVWPEHYAQGVLLLP
jgi:branched-chain amino acid transport system substrate-binding protein